MAETNVVALHKKPIARRKDDHEAIAAQIRKLYRKLCSAIDKATMSGLEVEVYLDSKDTYAGNKVRGRDVRITKKL